MVGPKEKLQKAAANKIGAIFALMALTPVFVTAIIVVGVFVADFRQSSQKNLDTNSTVEKRHKSNEFNDKKLVRRFSDRYRLLNNDIMIDSFDLVSNQNHTSFFNGRFLAKSSLLNWKLQKDIGDLDLIRMTFRGNGIPKTAEKLAKSSFINPTLRLYYETLTQKNGIVWRSDNPVKLELIALNKKIYEAESTSFVSVQKVSTQHLAAKQALRVPALKHAYFSDEQEQENASQDTATNKQRTRKDQFSLPKLTNAAPVRSMPIDKKKYLAAISEKTPSGEDAIAPGRASVSKNTNANFLSSAKVNPEAASLFLLDIITKQYDVFSVLNAEVNLSINALETRSNLMYLSFGLTFDNLAFEQKNTKCNSASQFTISDEYLFLTIDQEIFLIRIHLNDCGKDSQNMYDRVALFLNTMKFVSQ